MSDTIGSIPFNLNPFTADLDPTRAAQLIPTDDDTPHLEKLLRGEQSALEAYERVIGAYEGSHPRILELLDSIANEHEEAIFDLSQLIREEGSEPEPVSGPWGNVVQAVIAGASLFGETGTLWALRKGEDHGIQQYLLAIEECKNRAVQNYFRFRAVPVQKRHIERLSTLLHLDSVDREH